MQAEETKQASVLDSKKEKNKEIAFPGKKKLYDKRNVIMVHYLDYFTQP